MIVVIWERCICWHSVLLKKRLGHHVRTRTKVSAKFDSTCSLIAIREQIVCRHSLQNDQSVLALGLDTLLQMFASVVGGETEQA